MNIQPSITLLDHLDSKLGRLQSEAGELLDLFGKGRRITVVKADNGSDIFHYEAAKPQSWKVTALKVASWVLSGGLVPLLALAVKALHTFKYRRVIRKIEANTQTYHAQPAVTIIPKDEIPQELAKLFDEYNVGIASIHDFECDSLDEVMDLFVKYPEHVEKIKLPDFDAYNPSGPWNISEKTILQLKQLTNLKSLEFGKNQLTSKWIAGIGKMKQLEELKLRRAELPSKEPLSLSDSMLFGQLSNLRTIHLSGKLFFEFDIDELSSLPNLKNLLLSNLDSWTPLYYDLLSPFQNLESLKLIDSTQLTEASLGFLKGMKKLRSLEIIRGDLDGDGFQLIGQLSNLERLELNGVIKKSMLNPSTKLGVLHESNIEANKKNFGYLKNLTKLKSLTIKGNALLDDGFHFLKGMKDLKTLKIDMPIATNSTLELIGTLTKLKILSVWAHPDLPKSYYEHFYWWSTANVTNDGLKHLTSLTKLEYVNFYNFPFVTQEAIHQLESELGLVD